MKIILLLKYLFISQTIDELEKINGKLISYGSRLDGLSIKAGERNYNPECGYDKAIKSPENNKEYISNLISFINYRLSFIEDRISELERFI